MVVKSQQSSVPHRYSILPGFLLGFHGTDHVTAEKVLSGKDHLTPSNNKYDWLGSGIYFWEYSPVRALHFAKTSIQNTRQTRGKITKPAVVGAIIDPGVCLNLLEAKSLQILKEAYEVLSLIEDPLPKNTGGEDLLARYLDCAVVEMAHYLNSPGIQKLVGGDVAVEYDTVRGAFWEGNDLYPGAGFKEKNHIQICVRNPSCIKGYFRVIP